MGVWWKCLLLSSYGWLAADAVMPPLAGSLSVRAHDKDTTLSCDTDIQIAGWVLLLVLFMQAFTIVCQATAHLHLFIICL